MLRYNKLCYYHFSSISNILISSEVDPVLHSPLAVEKLGGGQNHGAHDGPRRGGGQRGREEAEEEASPGLFVRQFEEPQLVGLQILLL